MLYWAQKGSRLDWCQPSLLWIVTQRKIPCSPQCILYLLSYIMSSFCSSTPPRIPQPMQSPHLLRFPAVRVSQTSLFFHDLGSLEEGWSGILLDSPWLGFVWFFSPCDETAGLGLGRKTTKAQHHVCHISGVLSAGLPAARGHVLSHIFKDFKECCSSSMSANCLLTQK